jgi:hypothetical protein
VINFIQKKVTVLVTCENEEIWVKAKKDIKDLIDMMNNISRRAIILDIEDVERNE